MQFTRPPSSCGRIDPRDIDPGTGLPAVPDPSVQDRELLAVFNRLSVFDDPDLVLEALAHVEALTADPSQAKLFSPDTVAEVCRTLASRPESVTLQRAGCAAVANLAVCGEAAVQAVLDSAGVSSVCAALEDHVEDRECVYRAFDALASLVSSDARAREELRRQEGIHLVFEGMRKHRGSADVQFGGACALAGATMGSEENCAAVVEAKGIQLLLGCYRSAAAAAQRATSEPDAAEWRGVMRWAGIALKNVARCPGFEVDLASADFGKFGSCVAVDELKWELQHEQKLARAVEERRAELRSK